MDKSNRNKELFTDAMSKLMKNKLGMSLDLLNEILNADPDDRLAILARGSVYLKMNQPDHAISDFSRILELDPKHAKAHHLRGLAREITGSNDEALRDFDQAIQIDPEYGAAYYSRASLRSKLGQEDLAAEDMKMVAHLTNLNIESFANENNVWRSRQLQMEDIFETELPR